MQKLVLNLGYGVQFEGDHHPNGHPKNVCKVVDRSNEAEFARNVDTLQEMVDAWNEKNASDS